MKNKIVKYLISKNKDAIYDFVVEEFIGVVPDSVGSPAIDWLADHKVLFEKFLSIQAYHIQKARIQSKKSQEFYDGALMIIKAFLVAVSKKSASRETIVPKLDVNKQTEEQIASVKSFMDEALKRS